MSPSGAPLAVSHGERAAAAAASAAASAADLARCIPWFAPSAEMRPLCRSVLAATVLFTAATASADRVADQAAAAADATKPMNLRALIRAQAKQ
tara:strand:+ start:294 stop:575 length:282 start_codon:yes stop_codon:yes gene_type:complete